MGGHRCLRREAGLEVSWREERATTELRMDCPAGSARNQANEVVLQPEPDGQQKKWGIGGEIVEVRERKSAQSG